jgi:hypothetical protein
MKFFHVPVDLNHALTVSRRIETLLREEADAPALLSLDAVAKLQLSLSSAPDETQPHPPSEDAARALAQCIVLENMKSERMGQRVRNLFELIGLGQEGSWRGLECGENPNSLQRP